MLRSRVIAGAFASQPLSWQLAVHATIMCFAWLFLAPIALIVTRLRRYKRFSPLLTRMSFVKGRQDWYFLHRNFLAAAVVLTAAGGFLMIVFKEMRVETFHGVLGVSTWSVSVAQACHGCRPCLMRERWQGEWGARQGLPSLLHSC